MPYSQQKVVKIYYANKITRSKFENWQFITGNTMLFILLHSSYFFILFEFLNRWRLNMKKNFFSCIKIHNRLARFGICVKHFLTVLIVQFTVVFSSRDICLRILWQYYHNKWNRRFQAKNTPCLRILKGLNATVSYNLSTKSYSQR